MESARASKDLWAYLQHRKNIQLENDLLVMDKLSVDPPAPTRESRLLLPQAARLRVVAAHHELCCSHLGTYYTTRSVQTWAWWPGIISQTANYVSSCQKCRRKRFPAKPIQPSNRYIKSSGFVGECVCIDLFGPMPPGRNEETYCLTAIDVFSKYLFAIPIKGKSAPVVAAAFLDQVVGKGGAVLAVHSDNGKEM